MDEKENKASEYEGNFIWQIVEKDLAENRNDGNVVTRFPPEPNGYPHIGHLKAIHMDFTTAAKYGGKCNLRFDDTNPEAEDQEYVDAIIDDLKWLGYDWGGEALFASDYFEQIYEYAIDMIKQGKAYVDDLTAEEIREYRGTLKSPGKNSPYRDRTIEENLKLFTEMAEGKYPDGTKVLRAKIDMSHPNMNMRDPVMYRIQHAHHHRQGDKWCIYPMYDWAHGLEDAIEKVSHSLCSLEFEDHRPLYNWFLDQLDVPGHPRQIEFSRLNINYTITSKRKLRYLVENNLVTDWDDPRMPTIRGLRRRGYTPGALKNFVERVGMAKVVSTVDMALMEHCLREDLNKRALRRMAVLNPLKVVIENYPEDKVEWMEADNNPEDESAGKREIPFSREIYIERDDFMENPSKKYFRLSPGKEIRLKHAYYVTCTDVIKDDEGNILELRCTYDPASKGGWTNDGRKVKGTSHWVSASHAVKAEVRMYDRLFAIPEPESAETLEEAVNPDSLKVMTDCLVEPSLAEAEPGERFQFLRQGYFCSDSTDHTKEKPVFNLTVSLKDSWAKQSGK